MRVCKTVSKLPAPLKKVANRSGNLDVCVFDRVESCYPNLAKTTSEGLNGETYSSCDGLAHPDENGCVKKIDLFEERRKEIGHSVEGLTAHEFYHAGNRNALSGCVDGKSTNLSDLPVIKDTYEQELLKQPETFRDFIDSDIRIITSGKQPDVGCISSKAGRDELVAVIGEHASGNTRYNPEFTRMIFTEIFPETYKTTKNVLQRFGFVEK